MGYSAQLPALTHWLLQHIQPEMICSKNTAPPSLQCPCREAHISRNRIITSLQQVWKAFRLFQHTSIRLPREQEPALFLQDLTRAHTRTHTFSLNQQKTNQYMLRYSASLKKSCKTQVQTYIPGGGAVTFNLAASNEVPHTGHPVGQQGKRGHEQGQNHSAVLGVTVQLL